LSLENNLVSLEAVLAEIRQTGVDHIVCLGDVTALASHMPRATAWVGLWVNPG
jgi:hypothetical protein